MSYDSKKVFACLPQVERGVSKVIGGDPKGKNFLYTNGKSVIIRNIENPSIADIYTEHAHPVFVAKYAPSGFYIASGDTSGKVRIWDTTQKEHLLKYEYQPFAGRIKDIAWSDDSKRMAVVGEGREKFGAVFLWDTGSSVGEISGHSKVINSVDIKQSRPYRLVTGADDNCAAFFEGPPFKFKSTFSDHSRFVNCVRFSPDGNRFATASADGQIFVYDGKTGEKVSALGGSKAHDGGIYAICWSPDSTSLISASGDKTVKLWDVAANTAVIKFSFGSEVMDQQLGCLWQNNYLLSISLSGYINYLDKNNPQTPIRVVKGHSKSIHCLTVHKDGSTPYIYSGSHDGHINILFIFPNEYSSFGNQINLFFSAQDVVKMDVQPKRIATGPGGYTVVVCIGQVIILICWKTGMFYGHYAKALCIAWSPDNQHFATAGMDMVVFVWTVSDPDERIKMPDCHRLHHVSSLAWLDEHTLVTTSYDASVKQWTVNYK
ncbi:WD repeat-containing protein 1 [Protopterus annectens]|uniref:WD repeat-containing protein 1 n=1 Tax=Protopterus annectens TaxID=7888 RepID=UPI001CF9553B|nr:WD repeat-containing protein 1 [Protopterus annectens]